MDLFQTTTERACARPRSNTMSSRSPGSSPPTKQLTNQRDLALAYSPGVAASSEEIVADPVNVFRYTARGNLVAVIPTAPRCWAWARSAPWRPNR
jgi:malic enzyme